MTAKPSHGAERPPHADPLRVLEMWLAEASAAGEPTPSAATFVTVGEHGSPSARIVSLKRVERDALLLTSALWTRKVTELLGNPRVALLLHWPAHGRQIHITGRGALAERALARELWSERDEPNRLQTLVSRQGAPITGLAPLRAELGRLRARSASPPACPEEWGAIRVSPDTVELWSQAGDRLHERWLYVMEGAGWQITQLAP